MRLKNILLPVVFLSFTALLFFAVLPGMHLVKAQGSLFAVYGIDVHSGNDKPEIHYYFKIPDKSSLQQKLQTLADKLSRFNFSGLPINVIRIEDRKGIKVAIVDLRESGSENGKSWRTTYFQGTAGGTNTEVALKETFLQRDYKGQWIDEVKFLYEGKPIQADQWDHIPGLCSDNESE